MNDVTGQPVMIKISGLKKRYRLGRIGAGTLQGAIKEWGEARKSREGPRSGRRANGEFYALNGIDLVVQRGETLGIIGKNGAGKSTLLKILSQITAPTEGTVDLYGRVSSMLEVGTGFHGEMTGRENIYLNGAILGMTRAEVDAKLDDIVEFSEIGEFLDTPIKRYSSGMLVKLGFSVAVHLENEIVIMDEVLAVGDVKFQEKCLKRLRDSAQQDNRTVLYVSHNMQTVRQLCDRCIVLDQGDVVFDGEANKAIAVYLGAGGMMPTKVEFGAQHRPNDPLIRFYRWFTMESLELLGHSSPTFTIEDRAEFELRCTATARLERIGFRFELRYQDGQLVGSMLSNEFVTLAEGGHVLRLTVSFAHLAPGQYRADLVAFQFNEQGGEQMLDAVYPAYLFQVEPVLDEANYLVWKTGYWGVTRLEDIDLRVV